MKLVEIARAIYGHLKRFEADQKINAPDPKYHTRAYYMPNAWSAGSKVGVRYVSYQGEHFLSKIEALEYLAWLELGNEGTHWEAEQAKKAANA